MSQGGNDKDGKGQKAVKQPISIWPEWSDQDIGSEKWVICFDDSYDYASESFHSLSSLLFLSSRTYLIKGKTRKKGRVQTL